MRLGCLHDCESSVCIATPVLNFSLGKNGKKKSKNIPIVVIMIMIMIIIIIIIIIKISLV